MKRIRARFAGSCVACGTAVAVGAEAGWEATSRKLFCSTCAATAAPEAGAAAAKITQVATEATKIPNQPGASARREFERRHDVREERVRREHPRIGGLLLALADDPQSTRAWNVGAKGEEHLGAILGRAAAKLGWVVLHDRRIPGSRANIDHVVVSRLGASVIDAKNYKGDVAKRDVGGWKRADERLFVGGRDCSRLVQGVLKQREVVEGV